MITDKEQLRNLANLISPILKDNFEAVIFCINLFQVIQVWDDLIDQDNPVEPDQINTAFRVALVDILGNPFVANNSRTLAPVLLNCFLQWQDANELEKSPVVKDLNMAYMLRASYYQVVSMCAYLVGGADWSKQVGPDIRRLYDENLNAFIEETKKCRLPQSQ